MPIATTQNQIGNREQILDYLTVVEPEETPKLSSLSKGPTIKSMTVEFQADDLDAPDWSGVLEGRDIDSFVDQGDGRVMLESKHQKFDQTWMVSREQTLISTAGVPNEKAYAKAKCLKQLKLSIEGAIGADQEANVQSGSTPYRMRGLVKWTTADNANIPAAVRTPSASVGTTSGLTEATFNAVIQSAYQECGKRRTLKLFAGPTLKQAVSNFHRTEGSTTAKAYTVNQNADSKKVTLSVNVYDSDWGEIHMIPDLWIERTNGSKTLTTASKAAGLLIDPSLVSVGFLENPTMRELEDAGAGPRGYAEAICTVICKNPKGLGRFT